MLDLGNVSEEEEGKYEEEEMGEEKKEGRVAGRSKF